MAIYRFLSQRQSGVWVVFDFAFFTADTSPSREFIFEDVSLFNTAIFYVFLSSLGGTNPSFSYDIYNYPGGVGLTQAYKEVASGPMSPGVAEKRVITNLFDRVHFKTNLTGTTPSANWRASVWFK